MEQSPKLTAAPAPFDRAADILKFEPNPLDAIFAPKNVAVIGATETQGSVGRTILWNLISNPFGGTVFPVNPKRPSILGIKSYPNIKDVPARVDLAVIVTPAPTVPDIIGECVEAGVRGAIIISAGFKEIGPAGAELERRVMENAKRGVAARDGVGTEPGSVPTPGLRNSFPRHKAKGSAAWVLAIAHAQPEFEIFNPLLSVRQASQAGPVGVA